MCLGKHVWVVYQIISNILQTLTYHKIDFSKDHRPQFKAEEAGLPTSTPPQNQQTLFMGTCGQVSLPHGRLGEPLPGSWKPALFFSQPLHLLPLLLLPSRLPPPPLLLLSTQPAILLPDLSQEASVVTDCVRIAPLRVITLNSPLKDSSLWIEYKKTPRPPFMEIHDFCGCHGHRGSETLPGAATTWR